MLFLFLIQFLQFSLSISIKCIQHTSCHMILKFNQSTTLIGKLSQNCSVIESSSCFVQLSVDFKNTKAFIIFDRSLYKQQIPGIFDESIWTIDAHASVLLRYTVFIEKHPEFHIGVHITLECRGSDYCAKSALKRYWARFTNIEHRRASLLELSQLINSNLSTVNSCFDDKKNESETCSKMSNSSCFASFNGSRHCTLVHDIINYDFVYSFNQLDYPHKLSNENIFYSLVCHTDDCNNNHTINELSKYARQFADYTHSLKYPVYNRAVTINRFLFLFLTILLMLNH